MTNKNNIDEILEEFDKIYPRIMKINHSIERRESIKNFLKQKLQEVKQNTIEEIISKIKTIEGGWEEPIRTKENNYNSNWCIFLDPKSWEAVGKVQYEKVWNRSSGLEKSIKSWSKLRMHDMIDHLCEGGTIESYIETL